MMPIHKFRAGLLAGALAGLSPFAQAQTVNLEQAVEMSLSADPRIEEKKHLVESARGLLREAQANKGWRYSVNAFVGLAPSVDGGFYQNGATSCTALPCVPRTDGDEIDGLSDWTHVEFSIIKPLYTFGKIENYSAAAEGNIGVKQGEVRQTQADVVFDTKRAYFGYLTARDIRVFLEDMQARLNDTVAQTEQALKDQTGEATQADLFSLQAARGLISRYVHQARAVEEIALSGLKVLTGVGINNPLTVADAALKPLPLPKVELAEMQARALAQRPEMAQLEAGLSARRALVKARKSEAYPDVYAGIVGVANYASQRDRLDNPYINDTFNGSGLTPVVGIRWEGVQGVASAKIDQTRAELDALNARKRFALAGIPFEVGEAYSNMRANYAAQADLADAAAAARRWLVSITADYGAGQEKGSQLGEAAKTYVLAQTDYLRTVNDYNVNLAQLAKLTGELQ
jgi:outer membrane protein TolC